MVFVKTKAATANAAPRTAEVLRLFTPSSYAFLYAFRVGTGRRDGLCLRTRMRDRILGIIPLCGDKRRLIGGGLTGAAVGVLLMPRQHDPEDRCGLKRTLRDDFAGVILHDLDR